MDSIQNSSTIPAIRIAEKKDASALLDIYAPYVTDTAITFEYEIPYVEEFANRIEHTLKRYPYLIAEENGTPVGYAYASPFHDRPAYDWAVETSIYVDRSHRKNGIQRRHRFLKYHGYFRAAQSSSFFRIHFQKALSVIQDI